MDAPRNADASRDVLHVPTEMLEMILLAADWDWHLAMSLVCRRWRDVLAAWRGRAPPGTTRKLRTPLTVAVTSVELVAWARQRLPVGRNNVRFRGRERKPGGSPVGARK